MQGHQQQLFCSESVIYNAMESFATQNMHAAFLAEGIMQLRGVPFEKLRGEFCQVRRTRDVTCRVLFGCCCCCFIYLLQPAVTRVTWYVARVALLVEYCLVVVVVVVFIYFNMSPVLQFVVWCTVMLTMHR